MKKIVVYFIVVFSPFSVLVIGGFDQNMLTLALVGSALVILLSEIDKIGLLRFQGLEVQLRETINEANVTLEELKSAIKLVILRQYDEMLSRGRFSTVTCDDTGTPIQQLAIEFGLYNDPEIIEVRKTLYYRGIWDSLRKLTRIKVSDSGNDDGVVEEDFLREIQDLCDIDSEEYSKLPTPSDLYSILNKYSSLTILDDSLITEYDKNYQKYMTLINGL